MEIKKLILFWLGCSFLLQTSAQQVKEIEKAKWQGPQTLQTLYAAPVALIPFPQRVQWTKEKWLLPSNVIICFEENEMVTTENAVRSLQEIVASASAKAILKTVKPGQKLPPNYILLRTDNNLQTKAEGYSLQILKSGIVITAKDAAGFYNAVQTFRQIAFQKNNKGELYGCKITDWPAFGLRGFMHDNGRNFQSIEMLKAQLDKLSQYKYNTFHWHLTDNPAWRPQSKIYPQLNDPKNRKPGRDPEKSYSFDEIRELIAYAKQRSIKIIPELDMPGHSKYFEPTFGFKMHTEEGMKVLENLIDEFCKEIPAIDCPIIHLGSDEVHIPNPKEFIQRMTARIKANGRNTMVWNPGLPPELGTIEQDWRDDGTDTKRLTKNPYVDSYSGYLNSNDALTLIQRYFFQQVCNKPQGDSIALGGILCCWPDTRVDDKQKILLHNPMWPGAITYSEAVWCGRPQYVAKYMSALPAANTEAGKYFHEFEKRLANHRDRFFKVEPFPYVQFGQLQWQLTNPYYRSKEQPIDVAFAPEKKQDMDTVKKQTVNGAVLRFSAWIDPKTLSNAANETVYISTKIFSKQAKQIFAWIGFETAARSNRINAGIPTAGKWDANGGTVWVNDKELPAPQWLRPGANRYLNHTWETPANEIPYTDEEFYWSRKPAAIQLKKGWNKIRMKAPRTYKDQIWMSVFVPVKLNANGRWVEDLTLGFDTNYSQGKKITNEN